MVTLNVNMSKKSDSRGPMVPDGPYVCEVVSILEGESSRSRSPQLNVTMEVLEPSEWKGSTILDFLPLTEASEFRRADFFAACGVANDSEVEIDTDEFAREDADGNQLNEQGATISILKKTSKGTGPEGKDQIRIYYNRAQEAPKSDSSASKPEVKKASAPRRVVRSR